MTEVLDHEAAKEYRLAGLEAMLRTLAAYDAQDEPAIIVVYPGGGWGILDPGDLSIKSELYDIARQQYENHMKRDLQRSPA